MYSDLQIILPILTFIAVLGKDRIIEKDLQPIEVCAQIDLLVTSHLESHYACIKHQSALE
jgi:hypothetical protein